MAENSIRCFLCGLAGLIPLLGVPCCIIAIVFYARTRRLSQGEWNPARRYLLAGLIFALTGILLSLAANVPIQMALYHAFIEGKF